MHGMISRCKETGLKLNPDKCFIKQDQIKFYGIICTKDGIQPDPSKVSALKQMAPPANKQEVQTILGMANYMSPFIPNLSTLTAPLRELITDKTPFCWNATYQQALVSRLHQCPLSVTCFVLVMAELPARERAQRSSTIIRNCSNSSSQKNLDVRPNDRTRCYF